ncbi:uncharacterized protein AKAW2_50010S [Aspergillus luchuensis]|nr:uncharacterized protein AKAW2_50010S [Aspergillus luchuensis]BCR99668.1 hypothetical protein AKAW2_50010S [Aspergillus luchuensis]
MRAPTKPRRDTDIPNVYRRAKSKRLTRNDRDWRLKSRDMPDDFDTTQVLGTPFNGKELKTGMLSLEQAICKPTRAHQILLADGLPRLSDDDCVSPPLSSVLTAGNSFSAAGTVLTDFSWAEEHPRPCLHCSETAMRSLLQGEQHLRAILQHIFFSFHVGSLISTIPWCTQERRVDDDEWII